jgi:two-component system, OmpR family, sensor histidine kinase TctE
MFKHSGGSIRNKLLLWLLIPLVSLCTLSSIVAYRLAERFANDSYDKLLMRSAESIASRISRNENGVVVADLPLAAQAILRHNAKDQFFYQIADSYGHRLTGDSILPLPGDTTDGEPKFRDASLEGKPVRMYRISVQLHPSPDEIWVQVAETLSSRNLFLQRIFLSILLPQLVLVVLASVSVWMGVRYGLAPLERLGKLLRGREKLDLSPIDIGSTPAELAPVTKALNDLFANASSHIVLQRQFIGNAAHQLRTPVTALRTNLDYAERIKDKDPDTVVSLLKPMSESTTRVSHLINRLLSLARAEDHSHKSHERVNLNALVDDTAASVIHEALNRNVHLEFDVPEQPVFILGDPGELTEMMTNLFDNAIRYSCDGGKVWITVTDLPAPQLLIVDNGPGIPDCEKARVFERFYRIEGTTAMGCGLGLSIVREIGAHNNALVTIEDAPDGGAKFVVTFCAIQEASQVSTIHVSVVR